MKDSIIVMKCLDDRDIYDGSPGAERHHCIGGPWRTKADLDGLWIPLSHEHHTGSKISAHGNGFVHRLIQIIGQLAWEREFYKNGSGTDATEAFRKRYGKSFL